MKKLLMLMLAAVLGCSRQGEPANRQSMSAPVTSGEGSSGAAAPRALAPARPAPEQRRPAVDPKSRTAAIDVAEGFVDLLNRRRFGEAYMLLGSGAPPRAEFDREFSELSDLKVTAGAAGDQEGAAGSIYLSVPLHISGKRHGKELDRSATAILRRVNDVPGSSETQRRWHIERIDWTPS